jgi:hypothetical protein
MARAFGSLSGKLYEIIQLFSVVLRCLQGFTLERRKMR